MITRELKAGDVLVANQEARNITVRMTVGKEYVVRRMDSDGDAVITDDEGVTRYIGYERFRFFTLKEDLNSPGYISVREWERTFDGPHTITLAVDEEGFETILGIAKRSEVNGQRRLLEEQIATLQKRLEALGNA